MGSKKKKPGSQPDKKKREQREPQNQQKEEARELKDTAKGEDRELQSEDRASELLRQLMYDPETREIVAEQARAQEELEQLAQAMIFDPTIRTLLDHQDVGEALNRLNLNPVNRQKAIDVLSEFPYDQLRRLSSAFGFKDPSDIN
jgi:hypothetical protein